MSSVIVAGDVSGSVSLTAPSAAGSTVITLPSTSGTMITTASSGQSIPKAALPTGSVLQVVSSNTGAKASTTSSGVTSLGTSAAITPSSTSSKILINITTSIGNDGNSNAAFYIVRTVGGTNTTIFNYCALIANATPAYQNYPFAWIQLDSPATTSPVTYSLSGNRYDGGATPFAGGRAADTAFAMGVQFVLSEIAA